MRQGDLAPARVEDEVLDQRMGRTGLGHGVVGSDGVEDGVVTLHLTGGEVVGRLAGLAHGVDRGQQPLEPDAGLALGDARLLADLGDHCRASRLDRDGVGRHLRRRLVDHGDRGLGHGQRNHLHWVCHTVVQLFAIILLCC